MVDVFSWNVHNVKHYNMYQNIFLQLLLYMFFNAKKLCYIKSYLFENYKYNFLKK